MLPFVLSHCVFNRGGLTEAVSEKKKRKENLLSSGQGLLSLLWVRSSLPGKGFIAACSLDQSNRQEVGGRSEADGVSECTTRYAPEGN